MTAPAHDGLSRLGRAALAYAAQGWHVFPLLPRDKKPLIRGGGGFLAASADEAQVREWWGRYPSANIGLWPGQSGLVILDLDGPEGIAAAERLGALSEPTLTCTTGRDDGGRHLYFRRPDFHVSNCDLAPKLDVRGDAGYVVLPPSIHPTGRLYRWEGRLDQMRELPQNIAAALQSAQDRLADEAAGEHATPHQRAAREIVFEPLTEGGRNNALTRYAGRLFARGIPEDEVLVLVSAVNTAQGRPPLPQHEVNALVANVALREARKRRTTGGTVLALVDGAEVEAAETDIPTPADLAESQVAAARALLERDIANAPGWAWPDLAALVGPMLPGDLAVVGSLMGNGKSALLMSQMDAYAERGVPVFYIPLEIDPEVNRLRWAAWKLGLDVRHVIRQDWGLLPEGSREAVLGLLDEQVDNRLLHFCPAKRLTLPALLHWCRWAKGEYGARVVMLDHLHRLDFGSDAMSHRVTVTEVVRRLKDMARDLGLVLIAAAQLNRANDPVDRYIPPRLDRLKESAGIAEEADVVLMLSRRLKAALPDKWEKRLRLGELSETDLEEPGVMAVTCRKHRLDGSATDRSVLLRVHNGRVVSKAHWWRENAGPPPVRSQHPDPRYERDD